ncbi:hypothetical protein KM043_009288 [Ampulex compressa]|nr:hypothetical protein KM043_009288 [Ampulex compressa]
MFFNPACRGWNIVIIMASRGASSTGLTSGLPIRVATLRSTHSIRERGEERSPNLKSKRVYDPIRSSLQLRTKVATDPPRPRHCRRVNPPRIQRSSAILQKLHPRPPPRPTLPRADIPLAIDFQGKRILKRATRSHSAGLLEGRHAVRSQKGRADREAREEVSGGAFKYPSKFGSGGPGVSTARLGTTSYEPAGNRGVESREERQPCCGRGPAGGMRSYRHQAVCWCNLENQPDLRGVLVYALAPHRHTRGRDARWKEEESSARTLMVCSGGAAAGVKIEKPSREPVQLHITSDIGMHSPVTGRPRNARVFYAPLALLFHPAAPGIASSLSFLGDETRDDRPR